MTEQERINAEVNSFLTDHRHSDYIENERNADLLGEWLDLEGLQASAESLHAAYEALHDELDVYAYPKYAEMVFPLTPAAPVPQPAQAMVPQAPQTPVQTEPEETPLHTVLRFPGESNWMAAKRAFAEQQIAERRRARLEMRSALQAQPPRKTNARDLNNQFAAARKPRGRGIGIIVENGE